MKTKEEIIKEFSEEAKRFENTDWIKKQNPNEIPDIVKEFWLAHGKFRTLRWVLGEDNQKLD
ncbi:MAG: hypothetical protein Q8N87_02810, partial [bacterium]|nr:hypothetical protein [bacterium]